MADKKKLCIIVGDPTNRDLWRNLSKFAKMNNIPDIDIISDAVFNSPAYSGRKDEIKLTTDLISLFIDKQ